MKSLEIAGSPERGEDSRASLLSRITESRTNYLASYVTDFGCIFVFAYLGLGHNIAWPSIVLHFVFGLITFTLMEYAIHRWLLHREGTVLSNLHAAHHDHPQNASAFLFPTSLVVLLAFWYLCTHVAHWHAVPFFICGIATGYSYYGLLHHVEHTTRINQIPFRWLQGRWAAHSLHHRLDETNFGVITSFWDNIFKTRPKDKNQKFIRKLPRQA